MTDIEHRHLRSALEFAVLIAAEGQKRRPPLAYPKELKSFFGMARLPSAALGRVRRAVEADDAFRTAIGAGAQPELVDEIGRLWLARPSGWQRSAEALVAELVDEEESGNLRRDLKRAEKRRVAAEQAAARASAELVQRTDEVHELRIEIDLLRAEVLKAEEAQAEMRIELIDTRNEIRHARDREAAALERAAEPVAAPAPASAPAPDLAPAPPLGPAPDPIDRSELAALEADARRIAERLQALSAAATPEAVRNSEPRSTRSTRSPVALPGGIISTSAAAAEHLIRAQVPVFIDGYNVSKLAWPDRPLDEQRDALVSRAENLARRFGTNITVVFDGSSVVGAHSPERRGIRVVYSPAGVTADDVIRQEVTRCAPEVGVVVVTNDREIVDDVRAVGANVVPSNALIAVM